MPDGITHGNKDVLFKALSQNYENKPPAVYGLDLLKNQEAAAEQNARNAAAIRKFWRMQGKFHGRFFARAEKIMARIGAIAIALAAQLHANRTRFARKNKRKSERHRK